MTNLALNEKIQDDHFKNNYSDNSFWRKVNENVWKVGEEILCMSLKAYYALNDADTPAWAKGVIIGALGYFISPIDVIPDFIPVIGYVDDMGVLISAIATVGVHIKESHAIKAREQLKTWFN